MIRLGMIRLRALLFAAAIAALPALVSAPAGAASGACTSSSGVTVVVDFGSLGGGVQVHCTRTSGTGLDALKGSGYSVTGTQRYGSAFVCRINGLPGPSAEKCVNTPPADSSWHYWHASNGGSWSFSQTGASSRKVVQGGFEGWSFGGGSAPGYTPKRGGSGGGSGGSSSGGGGSVVTEGPSSAEDGALPQPKPRTGDTAPSGVPTVGPTPSATPSADPESSDASATSEESGSSITPWIGGALLLALLMGIVTTARERRT